MLGPFCWVFASFGNEKTSAMKMERKQVITISPQAKWYVHTVATVKRQQREKTHL
jgi:C4-dicarboxylate-specific signal transduction histidine kinase